MTSRARLREQDLIDDLVRAAQTEGFAGDSQALRRELRGRADTMRAIKSEADASGGTPDALLRAVARAGGISLRRETELTGEIRWLKQSAIAGRFGHGVFRHAGLPLDGMVEALQQDPRFAHLTTIHALIEALTAVAQRAWRQPEALTARELGAVSDTWWQQTDAFLMPGLPAGMRRYTYGWPAGALAWDLMGQAVSYRASVEDQVDAANEKAARAQIKTRHGLKWVPNGATVAREQAA